MYRLRFAALVLALAGLGALAVPAATVSASTAVPTLTQIRATHHPGYDRLVFEFRGRVPTQHGARYVSQVVGPSGLPVHIVGSALLRVQFSPTLGHNAQGRITYGPAGAPTRCRTSSRSSTQKTLKPCSASGWDWPARSRSTCSP